MGRSSEKKHFSDFELEILRVLWGIKEGSTRDICDQISRERTVSQSSINVTVSGMLKKKMLVVLRDQRPQIYAPASGMKTKYDADLKQATRRLFGPKSLVMGLLFGKHSAAEREQAKKMIDEME